MLLIWYKKGPQEWQKRIIELISHPLEVKQQVDKDLSKRRKTTNLVMLMK